MSLTKIGSIGINTGIQFAGVTTVSTLKVGSGVTLSSDGDGFFTGVCTATSFSGDGSNLTGLSGVSVANQSDNRVITNTGTTDALNAEANLTFDGSTLSLSGNLKLPDNTSGNANIYFGTGDDLFINHNGTDSFIINNTGDLYLRDLNGDIHIQAKDAEESVVAKADGAVELYYNNGKKLETSSTGVSITGNATISGAINTSDNQNINVGNGGDLKLYHDGSNSYLLNSTGNLILKDLTDAVYIQAPQIVFNDETTNENIARFISDGACELYHDNVKRFETHSEGTYHYGHSTFIIGDEGESAQLFLHADDGDDNADKWKILSAAGGNFYLQNYTSGSWESNLIAYGNGAVELYHDNTKTFETQAGGIKLPNEAGGAQLKVGASSDFTIEHDGSNTYLKNTTGNTVIQNDNLVEITASSGGTKRFRFDSDGLKFGSDTAAANALDDYEEGTVTFAPVNTGISFSNSYIGRYTKIGELVTVSGYIVVSSVTSSGNTLNVQMPFTSAANSQGYYTRGVGAVFYKYINTPTDQPNLVAYIGGGENYMRFYSSGDNTDWHQTTHSQVSTSTHIYFNICYTTTA